MTESELRELFITDKKELYKEVLKHFGNYSRDFIREIKDIFPLDFYFEDTYFKLNFSYKIKLKGREDYFTERFPYYKEFWKELI